MALPSIGTRNSGGNIQKLDGDVGQRNTAGKITNLALPVVGCRNNGGNIQQLGPEPC